MTLAVVASDNFTRANANPAGSPWTTVTARQAVQILSDLASGVLLNSSSNVADTVDSFPNDQWSEVTVGAIGSVGDVLGPLIRCTPASTAYFQWQITIGSTATAANWRTSNSTSATLATPTLVANPTINSVYRVEVHGQVYHFFENNVEIGTGTTDAGSHLASGSAGFDILPKTSVSTLGLSLWRGGGFLASAFRKTLSPIGTRIGARQPQI